MTRRTTELRNRLPMLLAALTAAAASAPGFGHPLSALATSSASSGVGYLTDASNGGFSLWSDALGIAAPLDGATYQTVAPAAALSVTIHDVDMTKLDVKASTALSGLDTLVVFDTCDIGNHANAMTAINAFVDGGGKVIILDGAQCTDTNGGAADYTTFAKPFTAAYADPDPQQLASTPYTSVGEPGSSLTTGLPDCTSGSKKGCEPGNATADASVLRANSSGWCTALTATSNNGTSRGVQGAVMAYARSSNGKGFVVYEGEAFTWSVPTAQNKAHLRLVLDDMLAQRWADDGLGCATPATSVTMTQQPEVNSVGGQQQLSTTVTSGGHPVPGVVVTFTPSSGGASGSAAAPLTAVTGPNGVATVLSPGAAAAGSWSASYTESGHQAATPARPIQKTPLPAVAAASSGRTWLGIVIPTAAVLALLAATALIVVRRRRLRQLARK